MKLILVFLTSMIMGVKIRTMWMVPFYLFFGVLFIYIFQKKIYFNNYFKTIFVLLFIISPVAYGYISITETEKRTNYPGKQIAKEIQFEWDKKTQEGKEIKYVLGDEWHAGNLSYHLKSRPIVIFPSSKRDRKATTTLTRFQQFKLLIASGSYQSMVEIKSAGKDEKNSCTLFELAWASYYMPIGPRNGIPQYINICFITN